MAAVQEVKIVLMIMLGTCLPFCSHSFYQYLVEFSRSYMLAILQQVARESQCLLEGFAKRYDHATLLIFLLEKNQNILCKI
jgi:hypothetical protein